jgi:hypothetical protein
VVYAGNVQGLNEGGTLSQQRNELKDVKLEIMFVIESSDFMFEKLNKDNDDTVIDYIKQAIRELCKDLRQDPKVASAVRFGFVEYKDNVSAAAFASRLTCDLSEDYDKFTSQLDQMTPSKLNDDFPDDVLAGLNDAVNTASWSSNSVKHIVLLGMASCQLSEKGQNPPQHGQPRGSVWDFWQPPEYGFNSSGLSIPQLIAKARPQGGSDSTARTTKMFHAAWFGQDTYLKFGFEDPALVRDKVAEVRTALGEYSKDVMVGIWPDLDDDTQLFMRLVSELTVREHQQTLALSQYQDMARNNGDVDGIFMQVDPGPANVMMAVTGLSTKINDTFSILQKVRDGEGLQMPAAGGNEIAQPLFTLVGASAEKFKESPVLTGTASLRNDRGREVAFKKVMVSEDELRRLRSTLDSLHTTFKEMTRKADRQDVGSILDKMKNAIAATSAGQDIGANVKLKDLISDLPLRTAALDTTPQDLASMTSEAFTEWLDRLESAKFRIDDLLNATQEWLTLSDSAVNDKFTFLRLSELP